jgi:hypothetical protein
MARTSAARKRRADVDKAKLLYDAGVEPLSKVREALNMSVSQFRAFRLAQGWPMRASPRARAASSPRQAEQKTRPSRGLIARLEEAVEREFARAETALENGGPKSIEQSARVLASLVRSLAELKRMTRDAPCGEEEERIGAEAIDDEPPRRLAELREELARRLERLGGCGAIE